jgi:heterodisulfide reductase subunit A-like polyferredoxin
MTRSALVIGGGIAGIQAATDLAVQGFPVTLVEKTGRLGGRLAEPSVKHLYPNMRLASEVLAQKIARLKESGARVLFNTEVEGLRGFVGSFEAVLSGQVSEVLPVGAIILAFGADSITGGVGHGPAQRHPARSWSGVLRPEMVSVQRRPRHLLHPLRGLGSQRFGCSRYCCPTAIKQATLLAREGIETTIFYRDIRTISTGAEEMYREARGLGVLFVRIPGGQRPEVVGKERAEAIRCHDDLLGRRLEVATDLIVLSVGMRPRQPETAKFHDMVKASLGLDGFFLERHPELAPVETAVEGVLLAGTVQGPKDIVDSVAQASAARPRCSAYDR